MRNAAIYSVVSSTGEEMSEKCSWRHRDCSRSCTGSVWAPGPGLGRHWGWFARSLCGAGLESSTSLPLFSGAIFGFHLVRVTCSLFSVLLHLTLVDLNPKPQGGMCRRTFRKGWRASEFNTRTLWDFLEACPAVWSLLRGGINTVQSSWASLCVSLGHCSGFFYVTL